jgi:hypothetical protein
MFEVGGFNVQFFDRPRVEGASKGSDLISVEEFEEGRLPRKLFLLTGRKPK